LDLTLSQAGTWSDEETRRQHLAKPEERRQEEGLRSSKSACQAEDLDGEVRLLNMRLAEEYVLYRKTLS
jgi:hypothetical protein